MNTTVSENASTNIDNTSRLSFHHSGDYFLPDLAVPEAPRIGKFGTLRHIQLYLDCLNFTTIFTTCDR